MGHEGPNQGGRLPAWHTGRRVVDGFIEAVSPLETFGGEPLQVEARLFRRHHQRQRRGVRRNDQILGQTAFEPEARYAECAVLVVEMSVDGVVAGFGNPPRHAVLLPIHDLPLHRRLAGLVEQRVFVRGHDQERHEVLEHRTAPGKENRFSTGRCEQTPQRKPALLWKLPLRNRYEAAQSGFRSQQIVVTPIPAALTHVVSNGQ